MPAPPAVAGSAPTRMIQVHREVAIAGYDALRHRSLHKRPILIRVMTVLPVVLLMQTSQVAATLTDRDFDLDGAPTGERGVVVAGPDLQGDLLGTGFTVAPVSKPEITSITPAVGATYDFTRITDLAGSGFYLAAVWLQMAGEQDIRASDVSTESPSRLTCKFAFGDVALGYWDVVVKNSDGQMDTLTSGFEVREGLWDEDRQLTYSGGESNMSRPNGRCVAIDDLDRVHVVWYDNRNGADNLEIYYKMYDGISWSLAQRLTTAAGASSAPAIAIAPGGAIHLVWRDERDGDWEIYYKKYDGSAWSTDLRLTDWSGDSINPSVAADSVGGVYVVWQDDSSGSAKIYFQMYDGSAWLPKENISSGVIGCGMPAVAVDGLCRVHVVWYSNDLSAILYRMLDTGTWAPLESLAVATDGFPLGTGIVADNADNLHVTWHQKYGGYYQVYYRRFNGSFWEAKVKITSSMGSSTNVSAAVDDSGRVHIVWQDTRYDPYQFYQIYYNRCDASGWGADVPLTDTWASSLRPSLAADSAGRLHLVWSDARATGKEIFYKMRRAEELAAIYDPGPAAGPLGALRVVPNPVQVSAEIQFSLGLAAEPVLSIYDVNGRLVRRIEPGGLKPGPHRIGWDATGSSGSRVAPGIYYIEISTAEHRDSTKIIVLR